MPAITYFFAGQALDVWSFSQTVGYFLAGTAFLWSAYRFFLMPWFIEKGIVKTTGSKIDDLVKDIAELRAIVSDDSKITGYIDSLHDLMASDSTILQRSERNTNALLSEILTIIKTHDEYHLPAVGEQPKSWCKSAILQESLEKVKKSNDDKADKALELAQQTQQLLAKIVFLLERIDARTGGDRSHN